MPAVYSQPYRENAYRPVIIPTRWAMTWLVPLLALSLVVSPAGCASSWWAEVKANPVQASSELAEYVQLFVSTAQVLWKAVAPLIGASDQAAANTAFNDAVVTLNSALGVYEDAVRAAQAAEQPNPDFSSLISNIEDAAAKVMAVVTQYRQQPAATGAGYDVLAHQAVVIAAWPKR